MGLFDKLIKSFTGKIVDDASDKAAKAAADAAAKEAEKKINEAFAEAAKESEKSAKEAADAAKEADTAASGVSKDDWKQALSALSGLAAAVNEANNTRKCPFCGDTVKGSSKFCPSCGAQLPAPEPKPAAEEKPVSDDGDASHEEGGMYYDDGRDVSVKLREVLASEFPSYTVKEDVSPTTIGGTGKFMNYSFAVYQGETPKLFMMIIGNTTCSHREYRWSKEQAAKAGVTMINFIKHEPNSVLYIKTRLHKYL